MKEYHFLIKQGESSHNLPDYISVGENKRVEVSNLIVTWRFQNVTRNEAVVKTKADGGITNVTFQPGYWNFSTIQKRLADEDITLTKLKHNNSCRIYCEDEDLNLGFVGELLGFGPNKIITKATFVDSNTVDINLGVRTINIACSLVNSSRKVDRNQQGMQRMLTIPPPLDRQPDGSIQSFGEQRWSAPCLKGGFQSISFDVNDNTRKGLVKLYAKFDLTIS